MPTHTEPAVPASQEVGHLFLLDVLRGLAALSVIFWHYQHFFMVRPGELPASFSRAEQPLYWLLFPLYEHGNYAVQLFFSISGFIFFARYWKPVTTGKVRAWSFFVLRFSRIYPLHFATLLIVAMLQAIAVARLGHAIVYPNNNVYHFVLNLFLASHWGLQSGYSFNEPIWSVSAEVLLYIGFFIVAALSQGNSIVALGACIMITTIGAVTWKVDDSIALAAMGFFAGGIAAIVIERSAHYSIPQMAVLLVSAIVLSLSIGCAATLSPSPSWSAVLFGAVYPSTVTFLASLQRVYPTAGKPIRTIGDISYSVYLVQFPVQLLILLAVHTLAVQVDFRSTSTLLLFLSLVIAIALPTYRFFELPAKRLIRRTALWERKAQRTASTA